MEYNGKDANRTLSSVGEKYPLKLEDLSWQDVGFLELVVVEAQRGRLEKRHASATDHADNMPH